VKIKLRYILTVAFTIVAAVPVLVIGLWIEHTALDKEVDAVWEKHLLIADHTAAMLERYAHDVEAAFAYFTTLDRKAASSDSALLVAQRLGLRHFCILDGKYRVLTMVEPSPHAGKTLDKTILATLQPLLYNHIAYSGIMADASGRPTIYLVQQLDGGRIAVAALDPAYLVQVQNAISFGQNGYAAILDHKGNVIAHPFEAWRRTIKSLATLDPVRQLMEKKRGVSTFHSPETGAEMIAGFTIVPQTSWGVMVSQPFEELVAKAEDVRRVAYMLVFCGILAAAMISWIFADRLTRPLDAVRTTARRIAGGKLTSRVPPLPKWASADLHELAHDFNEMAVRIQSDQRELATALNRAQSADHAKSRFLANMSHELRTPLNAVIGFSQAMEKQMFGPIGGERYVTYAADIRRSGEHLLSIINYILDLSKIEGGDDQVEDDLVDLTALMRDVGTMLQSQVSDGRIDLRIELAPHLPQIRGSAVKLKQILLNLVSNAVKYTMPGGKVAVSAWQSQGGGLSIGVTDTGIGMSKGDLAVALLPFGRADHEKVQRINGTGLGLPIAKRFIEIHGGRLEINSARGAGTAIVIHLPPARIVAAVA
jgi:signal transduction histidine kinase